MRSYKRLDKNIKKVDEKVKAFLGIKPAPTIRPSPKKASRGTMMEELNRLRKSYLFSKEEKAEGLKKYDEQRHNKKFRRNR